MKPDGPSQRAVAWLSGFECALASGDISSVVALFDHDECFWRDMVAFTWNVKTMEGRAQIATFLAATLAHTQPRAFAIEGEALKRTE